MRKFLSLSLLTALLTLVMSAAVWAEAKTEITQSCTVSASDTFSGCVVKGGTDAPITIKISGDVTATHGTGKSCITIESGKVIIEGEEGVSIKHALDSKTSYLLDIKQGAELTLKNIVLDGQKSDSAKGRVVNAICNYGTLNMEAGTFVQNFDLNSGYVRQGVVMNYGTFNMNGGAICNNTTRGGAGLAASNSYIAGAPESVTKINGGVIYGCTPYTIQHISGQFEFTSGLVVGNTVGKYNVDGEYKSGTIKLNSNTPTQEITIEDKTANLKVNAKDGDYFIANPTHDISATIDGYIHNALYFADTWHFINPEHDHDHEVPHQVHFDTDSLYMLRGTTKTITATVVCPDGKYDDIECTADKDGIVNIKTQRDNDPQNPTTAVNITAVGVGKTKITVTTMDREAFDTCEVTVVDPNEITNTMTLDSTTKYVNTRISPYNSGTNSPMTVTIPQEGINVGSTESGNCITITGGYVKLTGGTITHDNEGDFSSNAIITVEKGATLTLENVTINGNWVDGTEASLGDTVLYGIENKGTVIIGKGTKITGVNVDHQIGDNAILFNTGTMKIEGGAVYNNDKEGYVIKNDAGTTTLTSGVVVGKLLEGYKPGGSNRSGIIKGKVGKTITATDGTSIEFSANEGDIIMAGNNVKLQSEGLTAVYGAGIWDFTDTNNFAKANLAFVKGKNTFVPDGSSVNVDDRNKYKETFGSSHYIDNNGESSAEDNSEGDFSVSTGFFSEITTAGSEGENEYILVDMTLPSYFGYVKTGAGEKILTLPDSQKVNIQTNTILKDSYFGDGVLHKAENVNDITLKLKFSAPKSDESQFGIIVDNLYSPKATAYIRACTEAEYNAANDYTEVTVEEAAEAGVASVSLDLE